HAATRAPVAAAADAAISRPPEVFDERSPSKALRAFSQPRHRLGRGDRPPGHPCCRGRTLRKGLGRGAAVHASFGGHVAQVVGVAVKGKELKVLHVWCAVDCGVVVNPDQVAAQMEGGIGFGLGAAMHSAITLKDGQVEQRNFDGYHVLRMAEMPNVEVHIVPSAEAPTGVGEPGVAPIGPAVANAIFAATGKRHYVLPFDSADSAKA
ncbi:aldehyde oxidase, partial [Pseudomonas sp. MWU12-2534b]